MKGKLACSAVLIGALATWGGCATTSASGVTATTGDVGGSGGSGQGPTGTGASTGQAKAFFESTVYPDLATLQVPFGTGTTTCGECHATGMNSAPIYLGTDAESSYNVISTTPGYIAAPKNSKLVINGSIAHTGPAMNQQQLGDVLTWLQMEVQERGLQGSGTGSSMTTSSSTGGGGGGPPLTLQDALIAYGQCMDYNMWQNPPSGLGVSMLPSQQTTDGPCQGCHLAGQDGNWLSSNMQETFAKNQILPFVTRQVTGELDENGAFKNLVPSNRWRDKGSEQCTPGGNVLCHPKYTLSAPQQDGIDSFVNYTIQQFENGNCMGGGTGGGGGAGGGP